MSDYSDFSLTMTRGDTLKFRFTVKDNVSGIVTDISNWTKFWFTAKVHLYDVDSDAIVFLESGTSNITVLNASAGLVEVIVPATMTATLDYRRYVLYADVQGKDNSGYIWTLAKGTLTIVADVTRSTS